MTKASLKIIHCFRSPVGGIFRHVRDLIDEQVAAGHQVGVICDNNTGGAFEEALFAQLEHKLALGLHRSEMSRSITPGDALVAWRLYRAVSAAQPDILHAHGAKGGAYARIIGSILRLFGHRTARLYCPHGGSVHFDPSKLSAKVYFGLERVMERFTDRLVFVSQYELDAYNAKVGKAHCPSSLVRNGLRPEEFEPVKPDPDAADLLYVGMMRDLKGVDLFLNALPQVVEKTNAPVRAVLVGDGPDRDRYRIMADDLMAQSNGAVSITFYEPMPAREAFALGKALVVPSRAESMPYIVLEALAASVPLIATRVGGIPEIYGPMADTLVEPDSSASLADAMAERITGRQDLPNSETLKRRINENYSSLVMSRDVMSAYQAAMGRPDPMVVTERRQVRREA
ncbi:MAG: glycosyltransferase family 4 protein [Pseudomonadota bacterium]